MYVFRLSCLQTDFSPGMKFSGSERQRQKTTGLRSICNRLNIQRAGRGKGGVGMKALNEKLKLFVFHYLAVLL